jgi:hypothetical protein
MVLLCGKLAAMGKSLFTTVLAGAFDASSLSERIDFSAGKVDGKLMPCLSDSSELIAGSVNNGSQVQND